MTKTLGFLLFGFILSASTVQAQPADPMADIAQQLSDNGLQGLVHGADSERGLYVMSYHLPGDFFARYNMSLLARTTALKNLLLTLNRNDRILVKGRLGGQDTPQPHIILSEFRVLKKYDPAIESPAGHWEKEIHLPEDLKDLTELTAQVHAIAGDGQVIVIEYRDTILPLIANANQARSTKALYRGDVIRFKFEIQGAPYRPTHLKLIGSDERPLQVLERVVEKHEQTISIEGRLVLFPKSPTITRDVWAIEEKLQDGLARYYTLVNFKEVNGTMPEFDRIDQKLRSIWSDNKQSAFAGRNKFINLAVQIRATGKATVFDPNQANAQIHLNASDIQVIANP